MVQTNGQTKRSIDKYKHIVLLGSRKNWSRLLCTTEISTNRSLLTQIDQDVSDGWFTQDFVDRLIARQALIIDAAILSQTANLRK